MKRNNTIKMSDFDVATFVEMVQMGAYVPFIVKKGFTPTGGAVDGSDAGYNYIVPVGEIPAHRTKPPLKGNGSVYDPYTVDMAELRKLLKTAVVAPMDSVSVNMIHAWESDGLPIYLYRPQGSGGKYRNYYVAYAGNSGTANAYRVEVTPGVTDLNLPGTWAPQIKVTGYFNAGEESGDSTRWVEQPLIDTADLVEGSVWDGVPTQDTISKLLVNMKSRLSTCCGMRIRWRAKLSDSLGWTGDRDYYLVASTASAADFDTNTVLRFMCVDRGVFHLLDLRGNGTYEVSDVPVGGGGTVTGELPIVVNDGVISNNGQNNIVEGLHAWSEGIDVDDSYYDEYVESDAVDSYTISVGSTQYFEPESYIDVNGINCYILSIDDTNSRLSLDTAVTVHVGDGIRICGGALGTASHSEGTQSVSMSSGAHSEGYCTIAYMHNDHAEGSLCKTGGGSSHSEGYGTWSCGWGAHAEGYGWYTYVRSLSDYTGVELELDIDSELMPKILVGCCCYYKGVTYKVVKVDIAHCSITLDSTISVDADDLLRIYYGALGDASHAEGTNTVARGDSAHAEGEFTAANGQGSHSGGLYTAVSGDYGFGHGTGIKMSTDNGAAFGKFNEDDTGSLFEVGNGTDDTHRASALKVDENGDLWYRHGGTLTKLDSVIGDVETLLSEL